jgi:hypothetical protein
MTPSKYEIREALETIDRELSFLEISVNIDNGRRAKMIAKWQNVRTVLTGLLRDVAEAEGIYSDKTADGKK